jgi:hypothetical protein
VALFVVAGLLLVVSRAGGVVTFRAIGRSRVLAESRVVDSRHRATSDRWASLSLSQQNAAREAFRRGKAVDDPETARVVLERESLRGELAESPAAHLVKRQRIVLYPAALLLLAAGLIAQARFIAVLAGLVLFRTVVGEAYFARKRALFRRAIARTRTLYGQLS